MAYSAKHRFARIAPRKARLVMDMIRGRDVDDAIAVLQFNKRRASGMIEQVVRSAVANAIEDEQIIRNALYVRSCWVDEGPTIKRGRIKDRGKIFSILKRTSHLCVEVDERN